MPKGKARVLVVLLTGILLRGDTGIQILKFRKAVGTRGGRQAASGDKRREATAHITPEQLADILRRCRVAQQA